MDRNIPHVLDIFTHSPGARRRVHASELGQVSVHVKETKIEDKTGNDSAVSVDGSSDEDDETGKNISRYFDYLNDEENNDNSRRKKKKKNSNNKENIIMIKGDDKNKNKKDDQQNLKMKNEVFDKKEPKMTDLEKEMKHIERHLSMKKTIRKKIMRDLQQAFVENPGEFLHQDVSRISPDKKKNIDLQNLTLSKKRLSKSEHNFLDMLKDDPQTKEIKEKENKKKFGKTFQKQNKRNSKDEIRDSDDSGNGSPSRERSKSKQDILEKETKDEKKPSFWKRLTGKGKSKR